MKIVQVILGAIVFILLNVYQWLPFIGVLLIIGGVIGFITGSEIAGRAFMFGIGLLTIRFVIALSFFKMLERYSSHNSTSNAAQSQNNHSKIPVEITKEDVEAYEREQLKELESYKNDPAYNFDD